MSQTRTFGGFAHRLAVVGRVPEDSVGGTRQRSPGTSRRRGDSRLISSRFALAFFGWWVGCCNISVPWCIVVGEWECSRHRNPTRV